MRKLPYKTTTFYTERENFLIDIVEHEHTFPDGTIEKMYESYLYRYDIGIKEHIIGELKKAYKGISLEQYAKHILEYCSIVWNEENGMDSFNWYDEKYN